MRFSAVFGQALRQRRLQLGLSQEALAEKADIHRTHVGLLERGKRGAGLDVALKVSRALGVPLAKLVAKAEREFEQNEAGSQRRKA